MHHFLLIAISCLLCYGCGVGKVINYIVDDNSNDNSHYSPVIDPNTGEEVQMWLPKNASVNATWSFQARGEESRCANGNYNGKNINDLLPSKREIYKITPRGNRVWAYYYYYYYYGEDSPLATGGTMTNWYETVFNIYSNAEGRIYGCVYEKYPFGYLNKHGTPDGIRP